MLAFGLSVTLVWSVLHTKLRWGMVASGVATVGVWAWSIGLVSTDGLYVSPLYPTLSLVLSLGGLSLGRFGIERRRVRDATEKLRAARIDGLTGVPNRRSFDEVFDTQFARATPGWPLSLLFADVDHFKRFNDTHGHDVGDRVLVGFARTLRMTTEDVGKVFRVGGEEFAVLCPGMTFRTAERLAARLLVVVAKEAHVNDDSGQPLQISCSIGLATHEDRVSFARKEQLLKAADLGLYAAKAAGRNCARHADPPST